MKRLLVLVGLVAASFSLAYEAPSGVFGLEAISRAVGNAPDSVIIQMADIYVSKGFSEGVETDDPELPFDIVSWGFRFPYQGELRFAIGLQSLVFPALDYYFANPANSPNTRLGQWYFWQQTTLESPLGRPHTLSGRNQYPIYNWCIRNVNTGGRLGCQEGFTDASKAAAMDWVNQNFEECMGFQGRPKCTVSSVKGSSTTAPEY